jgi:hypothetical protein
MHVVLGLRNSIVTRFALRCQVVTCLPLNPRLTGLNPAEDDEFLRTIKFLTTTSFEGKWSRQSHVVKFYGMLMNPMRMKRYLVGKILRSFLLQVSPASLPDVSAVYYQRTLVDETGIIIKSGGDTIDQKWSRCKGRLMRQPYTYKG